jgi:hypothetical protein
MLKSLSSASVEFLNKFVSGFWRIEEDGSVLIDGDFDCSNGLKTDQKSLPRIRIKKITGNFNCSNNNLESLVNCPDEVGGSFRCSSNKLKSLKHSPKSVGANFDCMYNQIETLRGCTAEIPGNFIADFNELTSLEGGPIKVDGDYRVTTNKLTSLKGSPEKICGFFHCENNTLTSLESGPRSVGKLYNCSENKLKTLKEDITKGDVQEITITALSSCSAVADDIYNYKLSIRRSHSIFKDIVKELGGADGVAKWINIPKGSPTTVTKLERVISFKDLGFADREGNLIFKATNAGEKVVNEENKSCSEVEFVSKSLKVNTAIAFGCRQNKI